MTIHESKLMSRHDGTNSYTAFSYSLPWVLLWPCLPVPLICTAWIHGRILVSREEARERGVNATKLSEGPESPERETLDMWEPDYFYCYIRSRSTGVRCNRKKLKRLSVAACMLCKYINRTFSNIFYIESYDQWDNLESPLAIWDSKPWTTITHIKFYK